MTNGSEKQDSPAVTRILDLSRLDPGRLRELERFRRPITVLFADIVGSTAYFERYGDISGLAMVHNFNHLAGKAVEEHAGRVIKKIGDGIMATFEETERCVQASIEIQRRLKEVNASNEDGHRFAVRIGLHHGTGIVRSDNDVFGDVVNVASRIQSLAQPGQILVSDTVREKIADGSYRLRALGFFHLQGKSEERDLFEVQWAEEVPGAFAGTSERLQSFQLCHLGGSSVVGVEQFPISDGTTIGQRGADLSFPSAAMDSPHARFLIADGQPLIEDLSARGGVYLQVMGAHILEQDDMIVIGSRLFKFLRHAEIAAALVQLDRETLQRGERYPLGENEVRFGRTSGDYIFPHDRFMSRTHARVYRCDQKYLLEDLASRNGTYVKVRDKARIPLQARIWIGGEYFHVVEAPE